MRSTTLATLLVTSFLSLAAFGADRPATCELAKESVIGRSDADVPQVSNIGSIQIRCSVPGRPFPSKPGETRLPLQVRTTSYKMLAACKKELVASEVNQTGGGTDQEREWVSFYVHLPLEPAEADAEAHRFLAKFNERAKAMPGSPGFSTEATQKQALERLRELIYQHRIGHFVVHCQLSAQDQVLGVADVELEVLYKGRFSDSGLPGAAPM